MVTGECRKIVANCTLLQANRTVVPTRRIHQLTRSVTVNVSARLSVVAAWDKLNIESLSYYCRYPLGALMNYADEQSEEPIQQTNSKAGADPNELAQITRKTQTGLQSLSSRSTQTGLKPNHWRAPEPTVADGADIAEDGDDTQVSQVTSPRISQTTSQKGLQSLRGEAATQPIVGGTFVQRLMESIKKMLGRG